jgi:fatty-acyl-CoA synthase
MSLTRVLLKGASVVTMDDTFGDLPEADILIEGSRIAAVGPSLACHDAEVIPLAGCIVIPGLINAHMHTWQTGLRGIAANWTLLEYFRWMHAGLATCFTAEDIFCATQVGALNQINCGTTTLVDWCHNNPTATHTDAALDVLFDAGIRATFMHGSPKPDPKPGQPHFSEIPHPRNEVERLLRERFAGSQGLVNLAANSYEHFVTILSVLASGKVLVPLNPRNGDPELRRAIDFVEPAMVLGDAAMLERITPFASQARLLSEVAGHASPPASSVAMGPRPQSALPLHVTQAIKFTGGSTGAPKGVMQPYRAWNTNIVTQMHEFGFGPDDRYLVAAPLTHGTSTYMLPILGSGGALVFPHESGPAALLDAAEKHRATVLFAPPTLIMALADKQRHVPHDLSALRYLVYGGAPMRPEQIRDAQSVFGPILCTSYGQTEAPQIITYMSPREMKGENVVSVGRPSLLTQVAILSPEGVSLPPGEEGEIAVRGDLVMSGYLKAEEETRRTLVDGWLRTGDAGVFDERGYLFLRDRIRDVIITGGFNVYPSDVEVVIAEHPAVANCSVVGVPDDKWGEAVHVAIQVRAGMSVDEGELIALVKRELGSVKAPKEVHVFTELPHSPVGKILKPEVRSEILRRRINK